MPQASRGRARSPALPPITVGRFKEAARLLEHLAVENADVFLRAMQGYREKHAAILGERSLNAQEAAQIAAAMITDGQDPVALAERVAASDLRAQDRPSVQEMLVVAGAATAPELVDIGVRLFVLLRLPATEFKAARKDGGLDAVLAAAADDVEDLDMAEARPLAQRAFEHFMAAAGAEGNAASLVVKVIGQAFQMATETMGPSLDRLTLSSLTGSPPSTDGPSTTSSTS